MGSGQVNYNPGGLSNQVPDGPLKVFVGGLSRSIQESLFWTSWKLAMGLPNCIRVMA